MEQEQLPIEKDRKQEMPQQTMVRTMLVRSLLPDQVRYLLNDKEIPLEDISFSQGIFAVKSEGSKSAGKLMPIGGIVQEVKGKPGSVRRSVMESLSRVMSVPSSISFAGRRGVVHHKKDADGKTQDVPKDILFCWAKIPPEENLHSLHETDRYSGFIGVDTRELQDLFNKGTASVGVPSRSMMEGILSQDVLDTLSNPVIAHRPRGDEAKKRQNPVEAVQSRYVQALELEDARKKKILLELMIQNKSIISNQRTQERLLRTIQGIDLHDKATRLENISRMQSAWKAFVKECLVHKENAKQLFLEVYAESNFVESLESVYAEFEMAYDREVALRRRMLPDRGRDLSEIDPVDFLESCPDVLLRLFKLVPSPSKVTDRQKELIRKTFFSEGALANGKSQEFIENYLYGIPPRAEPDQDFRAESDFYSKQMHEKYGVAKAMYSACESTYKDLTLYLARVVFSDVLAHRGMSDAESGEFSEVVSMQPRSLVEALSGRGRVFDKKGSPETQARFIFEVRRKALLMRIFAKYIPVYKEVIQKGSGPFGELWEQVSETLPDIQEAKPRRIRFDLNTVVDYREEDAPNKTLGSFLRKILVRKEVATGDIFRRSVVLETQESALLRREKRESPVHDTASSEDKQSVEVEESLLVWQYIQKVIDSAKRIHPAGQWSARIIRFDPTPAPGRSSKRRSPGSQGVRWGKILLELEGPGEESEERTRYVQEVQIFTPVVNGEEKILAQDVYREKKKDDTQFASRRVFFSDLRGFAEYFFPNQIYSWIKEAHKRVRSGS